jgi:hypothetical protein
VLHFTAHDREDSVDKQPPEIPGSRLSLKLRTTGIVVGLRDCLFKSTFICCDQLAYTLQAGVHSAWILIAPSDLIAGAVEDTLAVQVTGV